MGDVKPVRSHLAVLWWQHGQPQMETKHYTVMKRVNESCAGQEEKDETQQ
jgi:hypothetical protein